MSSSTLDEVLVRLTPGQASHLAGTIRLELARHWEDARTVPVPCREDVGRLRAALDLYGEQLEALEWGEPQGDVELHSPREPLARFARYLEEGAEVWLQDPGADAEEARRRAHDMSATAAAITTALR